VACLREAIRLAQEEFVPLRVVRLRLIEQGLLKDRLLGSLRRVAEREIGLIDDLSAPLRSKGSGLTAEQAHGVTVDLAAEVGALRVALYERALQDYLGH
jgi:hypothetical protein